MSLPAHLFDCEIDSIFIIDPSINPVAQSVYLSINQKYREGCVRFNQLLYNEAQLVFTQGLNEFESFLGLNQENTQSNTQSNGHSNNRSNNHVIKNGEEPTVRARARSDLVISTELRASQTIKPSITESDDDSTPIELTSPQSADAARSRSYHQPTNQSNSYVHSTHLTPPDQKVNSTNKQAMYQSISRTDRLILAHFHNSIACSIIRSSLENGTMIPLYASINQSINSRSTNQSHQSSSPSPNFLSTTTSISLSPVPLTVRSAKHHLYCCLDLCSVYQTTDQSNNQPINPSVKQSTSESLFYSNLGIYHCYRRDFSLSLKCLRMALRRLDDHSTNTSINQTNNQLIHQSVLARIHSNVGIVYDKLGELNKSLGHFAKAAEIDGCLISQTIKQSNNQSLIQSVNILMNLARQCVRKKKYKESVTYLKRALELIDQSTNQSINQYKSLVHCHFAHACECLNQWTECLDHSNQSINQSINQVIPHSLRMRSIAWVKLFEANRSKSLLTASSVYLQACADARLALRAFETPVDHSIYQSNNQSINQSINQSNPLWSRSDQFIDELNLLVGQWQSLSDQPINQTNNQSGDAIPMSQHQQSLDQQQQTFNQAINDYTHTINQLKAEIKSLTVTSSHNQSRSLPNSPNLPPQAMKQSNSFTSVSKQSTSPPRPIPTQEAKMEAILCVVCLSEARCELFEPCMHLLCCHTCSSMVRACPFCKAFIKKRRGPIFM